MSTRDALPRAPDDLHSARRYDLPNAKGPLMQADRIVIRIILAAVLIAAPLTLAGWFAACPQYGDPSCPSSIHPLEVMQAFRNANAHRQAVFLVLSLAAPYLYPLSYLSLGLLAIKHSPWLALAGMACGWFGGIAWGFIADTMVHISVFAKSGMDQVFVAHENAFFATPYILAVASGWVLGHLLGYLLLGIALFRARTIPRWASVLLMISVPVMGPIAYGTNIGAFQIAGYLMVTIASIAAASAVMRSELPLPQGTS